MSASVISYLAGGCIENKHIWKSCIKGIIKTKENQMFVDKLQQKGAERFLRVHDKLQVHPIYLIMKSNLMERKSLMNTIKLLAFPERSEECECRYCGKIYTDTVNHYVMNCQNLIQERQEMWDKVLDSLPCAAEAKLFQKDSDTQLDTLLTKQWDLFKNKHEYYKFTQVTAIELQKLMYVI